MMKLRSLHTRALAATFLIIVPSLIGVGVLVRAQVAATITVRFDGRMSQELTMLEATMRSSPQDLSLHARAQFAPLVLDTFPGRKTFGVWIDHRLAFAGEGFPLLAEPQDRGFLTIDTPSGPWRILVKEKSHVDPQAGTAILAIAEPLQNRTTLVRHVLIEFIWPLAIAMPLLVCGIYLGLRRSLAPVTQIAQAIQSRSAERLDPIPTADVPTEVLPIVLSVNQLLSHIAASFEREKRFTADAAHELRTPLTALKTHAQVALQADEALRRSSLHKIVNVVNRTNRLISQLLMLARLDPQAPKAFTEGMNLRNVAQQVIDELTNRSADFTERLKLAADEDVLIRGEADTLGVLMRNLIENSLQYSAQGQLINVRVYRDGNRGVFEVEDQGPGIRDTQKAEAFRRFWRAPGTPGFGTGLGLSIVQRIVDLHGGEISLHDAHDGSGLLVSTRFPCEF